MIFIHWLMKMTNVDVKMSEEQSKNQGIKQKNKSFPQKNTKQRWYFPDIIRGITLISMMMFHGTYDIVEIGGVNWSWFHSIGSYIWQQSICWTFILLSGFCFHFGKKQLKRGFLIFGAGILLTIVTLVVIPEERVIFGVLTLIGSCMILLVPLDKILSKINPMVGLLSFSFAFFLFRDVNMEYLGFEFLKLVRLPEILFKGGYFMTYLGFTDRTFWSSDYFSLIPWIFLYITGYYLFNIMEQKKWLEKVEDITKKIYEKVKLPFDGLRFIGKHSLLIYMLHQPVLYGLLLVWMYVK